MRDCASRFNGLAKTPDRAEQALLFLLLPVFFRSRKIPQNVSRETFRVLFRPSACSGVEIRKRAFFGLRRRRIRAMSRRVVDEHHNRARRVSHGGVRNRSVAGVAMKRGPSVTGLRHWQRQVGTA